MKKSKVIFSILLVCLMVISTAGCGGGSNAGVGAPDGSTKGEEEFKPITIKFANQHPSTAFLN